MAKLIFFCGKMAAGKSTLARELAAREKAVLLEQDQLVERLFPNEIVDIPSFIKYSARLKSAIGPHTVALLAVGISVVLDFPGNTKSQRAWFRELFEQAGVEHELHVIEASDALCKRQLKDRSKDLPPGTPWTSEAEFDLIMAHFLPPLKTRGSTSFATIAMRETDLYQPIKRFLEQQGYEVKAEIGAADVVGVRGSEPPVIVETKTGFSLSLFHQGTERQSLTELVYLAVPAGRGLAFRRALQRNLRLCRRLGLGLLTVRARAPHVEVHADPGPYRPRQSKQKKARLLGEFARRVGDPNVGGATRKGLVTAYRQEATRCATFLSQHGATKAALVAKACGVAHARRIMADNHYGWFQRVGTGVYDVTPEYNQRLDDRAGNRPAG